jgi:hypothetical protein
MMNSRITLIVLLLLVVAVPVASAGTPRPWLSGSLGGSTYAMGDVNDDIGNVNLSLAGSGLSMDEINSGLGLGVAFGIDFPGGFAAGVGYDRLSASTDVGDATGSLEYKMPGNLVRAFGRYTFANAPKAKGFLEASLGRVSTAGSVKLTAVGFGSTSADLEGHGLALEGSGGIQVWVAPQFALSGSLGFRHAESKDITVDGDPAYNASGGRYSVDYSGLFLRAGATVALMP